ncbi:MAG: dihydroorotase [Segetibacter sp.]|nr:dihydroorotase [Segetibacter sp.]
MRLLLKQVTISDPSSAFNDQVKDLLIEQGIIKQIADDIDLNDEDIQIVPSNNYIVSPGWVDVFSHFNDPGFEFNETLESGAAAAAAGGYTHVFVLPDTKPVVHNKTTVEYIVQKAKSLPVNIHPLGAITKNLEGNELAEMYDMRNSGAVAFSDGLSPVQTPGLLLKALQYVKAFDGVIIQMPVDKSIGKYGLMNEGIISTQLGLPGIPSIAEELIISRDIELAKYTGSKIHLTGISTAKSIELIIAARKQGIEVTCSATPYHLFFSEEDLQDYDSNLKVNPPLRTAKDVQALKDAVLNGDIDCIASHHLPQNWDNKNCEFEYAAYGMIGLETSYAVINTLLPQLTSGQLNKLFSANARSIFSLPSYSIEENAIADLTIYDRNEEIEITKNSFKSKSSNSPFIGHKLRGKVIGIINKEKVSLKQ